MVGVVSIHSLKHVADNGLNTRAEPLDWSDYLEYLRLVGVPPGLLTGADSTAFHTLAARRGGETVATAMAERIYAAVGFRDLGRILEFVP